MFGIRIVGGEEHGDAPDSRLLDPALLRLFVDVVKVKLPRRPSGSVVLRRQLLLRVTSGRLLVGGDSSVGRLVVECWLEADNELLALHLSDGARSSLKACAIFY